MCRKFTQLASLCVLISLLFTGFNSFSQTLPGRIYRPVNSPIPPRNPFETEIKDISFEGVYLIRNQSYIDNKRVNIDGKLNLKIYFTNFKPSSNLVKVYLGNMRQNVKTHYSYFEYEININTLPSYSNDNPVRIEYGTQSYLFYVDVGCARGVVNSPTCGKSLVRTKNTDGADSPHYPVDRYRLGQRTEEGEIFEYSHSPNPAGDFLLIQVPNSHKPTIHILNAAGQQVHLSQKIQQLGEQQKLFLETTGLATGLYFVRIEAGASQYAFKFLKK